MILFSITLSIMIVGKLKNDYLLGNFLYFALGGAVMCIIGLLDDVWQITPFSRLGLEFLAAILMVKIGSAVKITETVWIWYLFSAFFLVGAINAINMFDGMDGLAGGIMILSGIGFIYYFYLLDLKTPLLISLTLAGSLLAFLCLNFYPAKVFLGDNGSYLLGFIIFYFAASIAGKPLSVNELIGIILIIGLPVIDAAFAIARRLWRRQPLFSGDRSHSYDILFRWTQSKIKTALICYAIQVPFVVSGILLLNNGTFLK